MGKSKRILKYSYFSYAVIRVLFSAATATRTAARIVGHVIVLLFLVFLKFKLAEFVNDIDAKRTQRNLPQAVLTKIRPGCRLVHIHILVKWIGSR
jgi:hypothetical protein